MYGGRNRGQNAEDRSQARCRQAVFSHRCGCVIICLHRIRPPKSETERRKGCPCGACCGWRAENAPPLLTPYVPRETSKALLSPGGTHDFICVKRPKLCPRRHIRRCLPVAPPSRACPPPASSQKRYLAPMCPENRTLREKRLFFYVGLCYTIKT